MPDSKQPDPKAASALRGIPVSQGRAAGPVYRLAPPPQLPAPTTVADAASERERATSALAEVAAELERRAESARDATAAEILRAQVMMAQDPMLLEAVVANVESGTDAPHAIDAAIAVHREAFKAAGGLLAERVTDLDDLRDRAVAACLGVAAPGLPNPGHPYILAATDLAPADTAGLDPGLVLGLVTAAGGPTSHTAILARAAGLPAVVGCRDILTVTDGTTVGLDADTGEIKVGLSPEEAAQFRSEQRAEPPDPGGPGRTADGHPVKLLINVGSVSDVPADVDCEGVGLFRTELLYLDRTSPPTIEEQTEAYRALFAAIPEYVVVRTLDAGADKPVPFLQQESEPNPALGVRGWRLSRRSPEVMDDQLRALAEATRLAEANVKVMAPMVSTVAEAADFAKRARAAGLETAGVMIEVPAAALQAAAILEVVDFLSIGTNDLSQYTFAADRQGSDMAELLDPWQPALLELIALCGEAATSASKPLGVCGEAASDPRLAPILVGLGVTSLSMSARALPAVRASLAQYTLDECRQMARKALRPLRT